MQITSENQESTRNQNKARGREVFLGHDSFLQVTWKKLQAPWSAIGVKLVENHSHIHLRTDATPKLDVLLNLASVVVGSFGSVSNMRNVMKKTYLEYRRC